jgi:hypothetical protein
MCVWFNYALSVDRPRICLSYYRSHSLLLFQSRKLVGATAAARASLSSRPPNLFDGPAWLEISSFLKRSKELFEGGMAILISGQMVWSLLFGIPTAQVAVWSQWDPYTEWPILLLMTRVGPRPNISRVQRTSN